MELVSEKKESLGLSEKLMPKELKKPKMYRLINLGKLDPTTVNEDTGRPVNKRNPYYIKEGVETIYDRFEKDVLKRNKIIKNITGSELKTADGKTYLEDKVEPLIFINGIKVVRPEEYHTYLFLERSNYNKSNPYRDASKPAMWEEVEEQKAIEEVLKEDDLRLDAEMLAKDMPWKEARAYAQKLGIVVDSKSAEEVRWNLRQKAKQDPKEFIKGSKDAKANRKMQIADAKNFKIISFDADANKWVWAFEKDEAKRAICDVPVGAESPDIALDKFFMEDKEGNSAYRKMVECLKSPEDFS